MSDLAPTRHRPSPRPRLKTRPVGANDAKDESTAAVDSAEAHAYELIDALAGTIGPRRPGSKAEQQAAALVAERLGRIGVRARLESLRPGASVARRRPDLGLRAAERPAGLTYDATPVLARGGRAITLSAQDGAIPNYHTESDVPQNIDRDVLARAIGVVSELVAAVDRGEAC
jgi:hypothetical protein